MGLRVAIEVAFVAPDGRVDETKLLSPNRVLRPRHHARHVLEAKSGSFKAWRLRRDSMLELRP